MINFVKLLIGIFLNVFYRIEFVNIENFPSKGGAVLCSNHNGSLDMFFIGYKLPRLVHYMSKEELFRNPILGALIRWVGAFPVKRGKVDIESIKTAIKILKEGNVMGIFPEGTRHKEGVRTEVKPGVAMIAMKANVPVIPVALEGSYKPFSRVKVVFGKPFNLGTDENKKYNSSELSQMSQDIMNRVYSLLEEH